MRELLGAKGEAIVAEIAEMNTKENASAQLAASPSPSGVLAGGLGSRTPKKGSESRTLCRPVFTEADQPINPQKTVRFPSEMTQAEFEQEKTHHGLGLVIFLMLILLILPL